MPALVAGAGAENGCKETAGLFVPVSGPYLTDPDIEGAPNFAGTRTHENRQFRRRVSALQVSSAPPKILRPWGAAVKRPRQSVVSQFEIG